MSLESEIDAENRARLEKMSQEEIAQAQAEIMEKMNPALLQLLKKRGQEKLKHQKHSSSDLASNIELGIKCKNQSNNSINSPNIESNNSHKETTSSNATKSGFDNCLEQNVDHVVIMLLNVTFYGQRGTRVQQVPRQRALALHLLASVLDKALCNIYLNPVGSTLANNSKVDNVVDWQAVWAFALGPEPELILSLRMSLDDNHNSVVLANAKVIHCILSCDLNGNFFDFLEKIVIDVKDTYTAPIFRSKLEIDVGFLHGGFWKYSAKPSNILPYGDDMLEDETEGKHTIQDDIVVAGQDFAAALARMGIFPRIRYLLEMEPTAPLEKCMISILIAIARHSPMCANTITKCQRLVQTVVHRFTANNNMEVYPSKIKSVCLLKVSFY
ncbi:hypothetical protein DITRI_Ditri08aG0142500 [Diplodiscus trichospermus]